jgi:hypothetical protein
MQNWTELIQSSYHRILENEAKHPVSFYTGIDLWDKHGGIKSGELTLLAGNHMSGCTTMAIQVALSNAAKGIPVLYLSSDLSPELFLYRCFSHLAQEQLPPFEELILDATFWDALCYKYIDLLPSDHFYFFHFNEPELHEAMKTFIEFREKHDNGLLVVDRLKHDYAKDKAEAKMLVAFTKGILNDLIGSQRGALIIAPSEMEAFHPNVEYFPHLHQVAFWRVCAEYISRTLVMKRSIHQWNSGSFYQPPHLSTTEAGIMNDSRCANDSERIYLHQVHCKFYSPSDPVIKPLLDDENPF